MRSAAALAAFWTAAATVFLPVLVKLGRDWWANPDYTHGLVMAPFAVWLGWRRRGAFRAADARPAAGGLVLALLGLGVLALGTLGAELFLTRASLLLFAAGAVAFLAGWRALRPLAFPLVLFALTIPLPAIVAGRVALSLQLLASAIAEGVLSSAGVPVLREGNVLVLPEGSLLVEEACSGIRSLAALFTLSLLVARGCDDRWLPRLAIIGSAVPIAVLVNGVRVTATAVATRWLGAVAATGVLHEAFGLVMFVLALGCLAVAAGLVARVAGRPSPAAWVSS